MPVYVSSLRFTADGNREIGRSRERFEQGRKNVEKYGGKIISAHYIVSRGEYLILTEFPNEEARVGSMISTLQHGNVIYEVFQAIPVDRFFKIVDAQSGK